MLKFKTYLIGFGLAALLIAGGLFAFKMFLSKFEKTVRADERAQITAALVQERAEKEGRARHEIEATKEALKNADPDDLVEYFRSGRVPSPRKDRNEGGSS